MKIDYYKLIFWKVGIVVLIIIGANHAFAIYSNYVALRAFQEQEAKRVTDNTKYNDGLKYGWRMGLLIASKQMAYNGEDFSIPFELSKDTVAYQDLIKY